MSKDYPLTPEEFHKIYSRVPRVCVDIVFKSAKGVYLTLRDIEPCKGQWHLPGGTVFFGESLLDAVKRVAKRELGVSVEKAKQIGVLEFPSHYKNGLDQPVSIVFEVEKFTGDFIVNAEASNGKWFTKLPQNTHADQDQFLLDNHLLT